MAAQSVYNEIRRKVWKSKRGRLFFPDDFHPASSDAVRSALVRLCRSGDLMRVAQGIYCYPKVDRKWGSGIIPPSIEEIAEGIAKRDKVRIAPTGAYPFTEKEFEVRAVLPQRTFLEKVFLLHEEFAKPKENIRIERMSRHLYDIGQIMDTPIANEALQDKQETMIYGESLPFSQLIDKIRILNERIKGMSKFI